jgi:choline dehydrogenase
VVLSGGAFGSPQLLLLSGVGPADHLRAFGIAPKFDLPPVGDNLADHFQTSVVFRCAKPVTINDVANSPLRRLAAGLQYVLLKGGPLSTNGIHAGIFTRSKPGLERPDVQINVGVWSAGGVRRQGLAPHPFSGFTMSPVHLNPTATGSVRLKSADPMASPEIRQNFFQDRADIEALIAALRIARDVARQPALAPYVAGEIAPGPEAQSDAEIVAYLRATAVANLHPVGSCRMGSDETCVVDPQLRVRGVEGLRIADASIMPTLPAGNTNAPSIMIGEKASAMILADAR